MDKGAIWNVVQIKGKGECMNLIQYIALHLDEAIEMLMDGKYTKTDCALFLMDFKGYLFKEGKKDVVDGEFSEVEERYLECK